MRLVFKARIIIGAFFIGILGFSFSAQAGQAQPVYSLKNLGKVADSNGQTSFKVQIKCNVHDEKRYIYRELDAKDWCVRGQRQDCFEDRIEAASLACTMGTAQGQSQIAAPIERPQLTEDQVQALAERKRLEEELLLNEERKLELRNRQLELRKREAALKKQTVE